DHGVYGHPDHIKVHAVGRRAAEVAGLPPERVFAATMNRDLIERPRAETPVDAAADGPDGGGDEDWDASAFGLPEADITHAVDVSGVLDRKRAAMEAHASQIAPDSFFLSLPEHTFRTLFG